MARNVIRIGLLWHSLGSGNLGVGALTEANIAILRSIAERKGLSVQFVVLGTSEVTRADLKVALNEAGHDLEVLRIRTFRSGFRSAIRGCDLIVDIGEGDSFADLYGFKRFFHYWLSKNIVIALGKPLVLAPQTIGPFDSIMARVLAKQVLRRSAVIFTRDSLSTEYLRSLGIHANVQEATDVAFRLPFENSSTSTVRPLIRIGLNVSGLLFNGGYSGGNQFGLRIDYAIAIRAILRELCARPGAVVVLVSHVFAASHRVEDDVRACEILAAEFPNVLLGPKFSRPSQAKSFIAGLDFFVGARMHACIAAFSSGVPVVPMAYSRKFNGLFNSLNYHRIADCRTDDQEIIIKKILRAFEERKLAAIEVRDSLKAVDARIERYEAFMENAMSEV